MVRFASSFIGAAIALSSLASAAPAKRQDITPIIAAGAGAAAPPPEGGLNTVDPGAIPTGGEENPSLGNSVQIETTSTSTDTTSLGAESITTVDITNSQSYTAAPPSYSNSVVESDSVNVHTTILNNEPMYGSGSVNWHESYNECVQTCIATYPPPPTVVSLPPSEGSHHGSDCGESGCPSDESGSVDESGASENGSVEANGGAATHEVMIEPSRGVQRPVPAFLDAAVGETVRFTVVNGEHSIVQSGALSPCNASEPGIDSGVLQAGGTFTITINSTEPLFFFSSVGADCASGLFGVINPIKGADDSNTTVAAVLPQWADSDPDIAAALDATNKFAAQTGGIGWGGKFETTSIPTEYHPQLAANILFTRGVMGANPEMVDKNGAFNPVNDVAIPTDVSLLLATANEGGYPPAPADQSAGGPTAAADQAAPTATPTGGAGSLVSSRVAVAGVALLAALLMF